MKGFPGGSHNQESTFSARDTGSIPGLGRPLERGMATHSSILAWRIPWTERLAGYSPLRCKEPNMIEWLTLSPFFFFFPVTIRLCTTPGLPRWLNGKESASQCRRHRRHEFHLWVGKIPWKGNGNPLQYSCLENPMDRGTWQATVHGVSKTQMLLNTEVHTHTIWDSIPCKGT